MIKKNKCELCNECDAPLSHILWKDLVILPYSEERKDLLVSKEIAFFISRNNVFKNEGFIVFKEQYICSLKDNELSSYNLNPFFLYLSKNYGCDPDDVLLMSCFYEAGDNLLQNEDFEEILDSIKNKTSNLKKTENISLPENEDNFIDDLQQISLAASIVSPDLIAAFDNFSRDDIGAFCLGCNAPV